MTISEDWLRHMASAGRDPGSAAIREIAEELLQLRASGTTLLGLLDDYMTVSSMTADDRYSDAINAFRKALAPAISVRESVRQDPYDKLDY